MTRRPQLGISPVAVVVLLGVIILVVVLVLNSGVGPDGLTSHVNDYIAMLDNRPNNPLTGKAVGPAVVVDVEGKQIDTLHDRLPSALRAENHGEVGTVILLVRSGTGIGAGSSMGLGVAMDQGGSYAIGAFLYDKSGTPLGAHSVIKKTTMTGAGEEAQAKAEADQEMLAWIESQF